MAAALARLVSALHYFGLVPPSREGRANEKEEEGSGKEEARERGVNNAGAVKSQLSGRREPEPKSY